MSEGAPQGDELQLQAFLDELDAVEKELGDLEPNKQKQVAALTLLVLALVAVSGALSPVGWVVMAIFAVPAFIVLVQAIRKRRRLEARRDRLLERMSLLPEDLDEPRLPPES